MPALASMDPWSIFDAIDRSLGATWTWSPPTWPQFDVEHTDDAVIVTADVPGMTEEDLSLTLTGRTLTVEGKIQRRRSTVEVSRRFELAEGLDLDRIEAEVKHGVLTIYVPKADSAKPRKIKLGSGVLDKVRGLFAKPAE